MLTTHKSASNIHNYRHSMNDNLCHHFSIIVSNFFFCFSPQGIAALFVTVSSGCNPLESENYFKVILLLLHIYNKTWNSYVWYRQSRRSKAYILNLFDLPLHSPIYDKLNMIIFHQKHGHTGKMTKITLLTIYIQWKQCQTLLQTRQKTNTIAKRSATYSPVIPKFLH